MATATGMLSMMSCHANEKCVGVIKSFVVLFWKGVNDSLSGCGGGWL